MEEDLRTGDQSWWNPKRNSNLGAPSSIISCSTATAEIEGRARARYCEESAGSACDSSITSQETLKFQSIMPSISPSPSSINWTQALLNGGRSESSFHAMLREDDLGSRPCIKPDSFTDSDPLSEMNQHNFGSSYKCPSTLQELLESEPQQSMYDDDRVLVNCYPSPGIAAAPYQGSSNEPWQTSWAKFSHNLLDSSLPKHQFSSNNQLQFTNNAPFWNASPAASLNDFRSVLCSLTPSQFVTQPKTDGGNLTAKVNNPRVQDSCSSSTHKTGSEHPTPIKKPRIETPSPLPTFKVRKEKLGDRITALQQLVSPFGKTDTASVLQEAIEYIKFLHDQVGVLSSPYLKNRHPMQQSQVSDKLKDCDELAQDLRSRGLCLVPITSTYPVASETTADFWHPTFGGTFG